MKPILKIGAGVLAAGISYSIYKAYAVKKAIEQLQYQIVKIDNVKFDNFKLTGNISIKLINATNTGIGLNAASLITLKQLILIDAQTDKQLGVANTNISKIAIPAQSQVIIDNVPIQVSIIDALFGYNFNNLKVQLVLETFGKKYFYATSK